MKVASAGIYRRLPCIGVGDQLKGTHVGTITVQIVLGWKFRARMAIALLLFRIGAAVAPARVDIERAEN
jgi:hypothetical protein